MAQSKSIKKPQSLSKELRITRKLDFMRLRKTASKNVARHWVLFFAKNDLTIARLAVTISARYGNAVERNFFRRWLREKFRKNKKSFHGFDLHFIAKQKTATLDKKSYKEELNEDYQRLLHRFS